MQLKCRHPAQESGKQGQAPTGEGRRRRGGRARIRSRAARRVQDAGSVVGNWPVAGSQAERLLDSDSRLPYILTWTKAPVLHQNAGRGGQPETQALATRPHYARRSPVRPANRQSRFFSHKFPQQQPLSFPPLAAANFRLKPPSVPSSNRRVKILCLTRFPRNNSRPIAPTPPGPPVPAPLKARLALRKMPANTASPPPHELATHRGDRNQPGPGRAPVPPGNRGIRPPQSPAGRIAKRTQFRRNRNNRNHFHHLRNKPNFPAPGQRSGLPCIER